MTRTDVTADLADAGIMAGRARRSRRGRFAPRRLLRRLRWRGLVRSVTIWNYFQLLGGSAGRLVLSLAYFFALTRSLNLADFGIFTSAVAVGTILSRVAAFGYGANLFQVSATRPRLLGRYLTIYGLWLLASLPVCFAASWGVFALAFEGSSRFVPFLLVVASEAIVWRVLDTISTINSGLGRFGYAATSYNVGTACRALSALAFLPSADHSLATWSKLYFAANLLSLAVVALLLMPRVRPRYRRGSALLRWRNALALGGAGLSASAQIEIDKLLVLLFGGPVTAGLYAICIRVIDLTAVPTRAFNVLMIQRVLTNGAAADGRSRRILTEVLVALASTATFAGLIAIVKIWPNALGQDIGRAAGLFALLWAVPALRNLVEYQAELLYAHGRMTVILCVALVLTVVKTGMMASIFASLGQDLRWVVPMNAVFLVAYLISTFITYRALAQPRSANPEDRR